MIEEGWAEVVEFQCAWYDNLAPYVTLKAKSEIVADIGLRLKTSALLVINFVLEDVDQVLPNTHPCPHPGTRSSRSPQAPLPSPLLSLLHDPDKMRTHTPCRQQAPREREREREACSCPGPHSRK